jgi:predicted phosphoribosyltransferase
MVFPDRYEAGAELGRWLNHYAGRADVVVLALPRGGVPVAFEVAEALDAPLDVFIVRKLGLPGRPEYAIGAIASGGVRVLNDDLLGACAVPDAVIDAVTQRERDELERRERAYRQGSQLIPLRARIVILVDDGLATGSTMKAAVEAVRQHGPSRIVVAVPVAASSSCQDLSAFADEVVCVRTPEPFTAVGLWYGDFSQTTDDEVRALLRAHAQRYMETQR